MKRIQRGIQSPHARVEEAVPVLGRRARMRDSHAPGSRRPFWLAGSRGRKAAAMLAVRRKVLMVWSLLLTVLTVVVIAVFIGFWLDSRDLQIEEEEAARVPTQERNVSKFSSPGEGEALGLVQRALAVRDPAKVPALFRLGEATPEQVVAFLVDSDARDGRIQRYDWLRSMDVDGMLIEGVLVSYDEAHAERARLAFLTPDEAGVWKMDFDAYARASRPGWQDLLSGRAKQALVRVFVARDTYYNGPFQDESQWVCYGVASPESKALLPEGQESLRAYCKVGSAQAKAMAHILTAEIQTCRMTLELRRAQGADSRQFEIARVLSEDWVLPPVAADVKFR
ncbi:MAG: hypothetical protein WCJ14_08265 [Verrucomicrobiota bacterium]